MDNVFFAFFFIQEVTLLRKRVQLFNNVNTMPYCPECGKQVAPTAKFCRNCGASQLEESSSAILPAQLPLATRTCASCGNPLSPEEKFCGACGFGEGEKLQQGSPAASPGSSSPPATIPAPTPVPPSLPSSPPPPNNPSVVSQPSQPSAVRLCRSCGHVINPGDKFCKKCLAKVADSPMNPPASNQEPVSMVSPVSPFPPPSLNNPPPESQPSQPSAVRLCRSCGHVINPGDKFCKKCLAKVADSPMNPPASNQEPVSMVSPVSPLPPPSLNNPPPESQPSQPSAVRLCRSCGYLINPGDKFCKKCLAKVAEDFPAAHTAPLPRNIEVPPPPVSQMVCRSCGNPVNGTEKFCGICGTPLISTSSEQVASPPEGIACTNCGAPVSATAKFCGGCGTTLGTAVTSGTTPPSPSASFTPRMGAQGTTVATGEEVVGVIANARKMKMFGASWDTYTLVITNRRMIIAQMTQALLNAAIMEAQSKAKAEGKGFFAIMKDQMAAQFQFALRYELMSPDQSLAETPGNIAIDNTHITAITMKLRDSGSGDIEYTEFRMMIESAGGKSEYMIGEDDRFINLLKNVYGEKVHMPFGYFKAGGIRLKFF